MIPRTMQGEKINDDFELFKKIIRDSANCESIYRPGPYWKNATLSAAREIKYKGLTDFRGSTNNAATSFGDNQIVDLRLSYNRGLRLLLKFIYQKLYPLNNLFSFQVNLTKSYANELIKYKNEYLKNHPRIRELLNKYNIAFNTTKGGCITFVEINGVKISHHYLEILSTLDFISKQVRITPQTRFMEIGGGFGVNVHLLVELFGVRKIIYLDISPNLYIGTQYLRSFYNNNVTDCQQLKNRPLKFKRNSELEIFCVLPKQIESAQGPIDVFHNAHSFVEMPQAAIKNYVKFIKKLMRKPGGYVSMVSYDGFDLDTTLDPDRLPLFFGGEAKKYVYAALTPGRKNFHYVLEI